MQNIIDPIDRNLLKAELTKEKRLRSTNKSSTSIDSISSAPWMPPLPKAVKMRTNISPISAIDWARKNSAAGMKNKNTRHWRRTRRPALALSMPCLAQKARYAELKEEFDRQAGFLVQANEAKRRERATVQTQIKQKREQMESQRHELENTRVGAKNKGRERIMGRRWCRSCADRSRSARCRLTRQTGCTPSSSPHGARR